MWISFSYSNWANPNIFSVHRTLGILYFISCVSLQINAPWLHFQIFFLWWLNAAIRSLLFCNPQSSVMSTGPPPSINPYQTSTTQLLIAASAITRALLTALVKGWPSDLPRNTLKCWALRSYMIRSFKYSHNLVLFGHFLNIMPVKLWHLKHIYYRPLQV